MTAPALAQDRALPTAFEGKVEPNWYCRAWNEKRRKYCAARAGAGTTHSGVGRCRRHDGGGDQKLRHGQGRRYGFTRAARVGELLERHLEDPEPLNLLPELAAARALFEDYVERHDLVTEALLSWHRSFVRGGTISAKQEEALRRVFDEMEAIGYGGDDLSDEQREDLNVARAALTWLTAPPAQKPPQLPDVADAYKILAEISKVVARIETIRAKNAITYDQLKRFLFAVERALEVRIRAAFRPAPEGADLPAPAVRGERLLAQLRNDFLQIRP